VYAPPLGPRGMADGIACPKDADALTKLSILGGYKAFYPLVGEAPTGAAAALVREWVSSSGWVRGKGEGGRASRVEEARGVLKAVVEAAGAVYTPVRAAMRECAERLGAMDAKVCVCVW
jgi:hypothetical protein